MSYFRTYVGHRRSSVTLINGKQLEGEFGEFYRGYVNYPGTMVGKTIKVGYPATYEINISQLDRIDLFRNDKGEVLATVSAKDGTITEDISQLEFIFDGGHRLKGVHYYSYIPVQDGSITVEVPIAEIKTLQRQEDQILLILKNGKMLEGNSISSEVLLAGETTAFGVPAAFRSYFSDIQSITFQ